MLPAAFLRKFEGGNVSFTVNRGIEPCITLYTQEWWEEVLQDISKLNNHIDEHRQMKRLFLNGATELEKDGAGRILIPKTMLDYASITKDAVFSSQYDRIEIWNPTLFKEQITTTSPEYNVLSNKVMSEVKKKSEG